MISSTARDLPKHREQARLACERAGFEPREMMEHLTALDSDAIQTSLRMVESADVYLGVLAYRYGTIPAGCDISTTEMEYNRAVELDKPRLMFFIHKDHPVVIEDVETGPGAEKLKALKDRIGEQRVAAFFKSPEDLRSHIVEGLSALGKKLDAAETGESPATALHRSTSIPTPPEPYVAHPYTLLQTHELIGRQTELNALTDWVANPVSTAFGARVFCFVAIGGMGKSALAWKWFNRIAPHEIQPLAGRLWWSFYESDATFENFLIPPSAMSAGKPRTRSVVSPGRSERLGRCGISANGPISSSSTGWSASMDASYLADDDYDQRTSNFVAGAEGLPYSTAQSFIGRHRLRQTTDPRAGAFLQKLAQSPNSRILITTRLFPSALQRPTGDARPGCFAHFLRGLREDDALALWRALNVSGSRDELAPIFRSVEAHPLLVQASASEVANYRKAPGDFARWRADHPNFDPTSLPLVQSRTHILEFALSGLSPEIREVLHTLRRALVLNREVENQFQEGASLQNLGRLLSVSVMRGDRQWEGVVSAYLGELALSAGDPVEARFWSERAWQLAAAQRHERDFIRAALLQGSVALVAGELSRAEERLHHALTRTRAVNIVELELAALIAIAALALKRGDPASARASLGDVWEAAERAPYRLYQADAFDVLAAIEAAEGHKEAPIAAATESFKAAWCDGPPYAYHWGLQKAKAQLAVLGAPEPVLPPFDESRFAPMPEVEINPKDKFWVDPDKLD
jgi:hypothetical protein